MQKIRVFAGIIIIVACAASVRAQEWSRDYSFTQSEKDGYDETYAIVPVDEENQDQTEELKPPKNSLAHIAEEEFSPLEELYGERVGEELHQFGYDAFSGQADDEIPAPVGAVQDDFILGVGDELQVSFSGQRNTQSRYKIDTQGQLLIEDFPPLMAAGLSLGEVKDSLVRAASALHNTQAYVTLSAVRQINVLIVGHVEKPGQRNLTVFHTVLDALMRAGGVRKDGSLRQIKIVRGGKSEIIDLYDILMEGGIGSDLRLRDGDRIIVPPVGPTVAIAGAVKRPGIYEIKADAFKGLMGKSSAKLSLRNMLQFSGGVLGAGQNRFMALGIGENGYEVVEEIKDETLPVFQDGSVLVVARGQDKKTGEIQLLGETRRPGLHDLITHPMLSDILFDQQVLGNDIYPLIAVIEHWDPDRLSSAFESYSIRSVLKNESNEKLNNGDKIYLFSNQDISKAFKEKDDDTADNKMPKTKKENGTENESILDDHPALFSYLQEHAAVIRGGVRAPGIYPVGPDVTLQDVIAAAGGLTAEADAGNIEITSTTANEDKNRLSVSMHTEGATLINPGDAVRVMQKFRKREEQGVLIMGEVVNPGRYDILPDDKISDLLARAGGLTPQAYPIGAVFSRESERKAEEARFRAAKQDMERSLAAAIQREKNPPDATQIEMVRGLAAELAAAKAVGRITVETDPAVLGVKPELDMLLEPGDRLYMPKRPLTVRVSGEVLSPASLQFAEGKDPVEYIQEAGGLTFHADKKRAFVLYPDGSAQPLRVSAWNHKPIMIPPGSTIIVPRDPKPFDFIESARDFTQILSNLAVTAIFVDDLRE